MAGPDTALAQLVDGLMPSSLARSVRPVLELRRELGVR